MRALLRPRRDVDGDVAVVAGGSKCDLALGCAVLRLVRDLGVVLLELVEEDLVLLLLEPFLVLVVEAVEALVAVAVDNVRGALVLGLHERHSLQLREPDRKARGALERVAGAGDRAAAGLGFLLRLALLVAAAARERRRRSRHEHDPPEAPHSGPPPSMTGDFLPDTGSRCSRRRQERGAPRPVARSSSHVASFTRGRPSGSPAARSAASIASHPSYGTASAPRSRRRSSSWSSEPRASFPARASSSSASTVSVASFLFVPITPVGPRLIQPAA